MSGVPEPTETPPRRTNRTHRYPSIPEVEEDECGPDDDRRGLLSPSPVPVIPSKFISSRCYHVDSPLLPNRIQ